jgi:hypothetical protein
MSTTDVNQVDRTAAASERGLLIMVLVMVLAGTLGVFLMAG